MKNRIASVGFVVGLLGAMFAVGGIDNAESVSDWIYVVGVTVSSLMLMQVSVWMLKGEI